MRFSILSLFPEYFDTPFSVSMIKRAKEKGLLTIDLIDIRKFSKDKRHRVDDRPFGGGPGMVLKPQPTMDAIRAVKEPHAKLQFVPKSALLTSDSKEKNSRVIYLSPQGKPFSAKRACELAQEEHLILLCGHYEGIDERIIHSEVDEELSVGDFVLTSGCPAAVIVVDAVSRFIPGVLGHAEAAEKDSFQEDGLFDYPHYTHPEIFEGEAVPEVLRSGNHQKIAAWRKEKALEKTRLVRPDLFS